MYVLLLASTMVLGQGENTRSFSNTISLLGNDWSQVRKMFDEGSSDPIYYRPSREWICYKQLSLRQGAKWDSGNVWLITYNQGAGINNGTAYKGVYRLGWREEDDDALLLRLGFTRKYNASGASAESLSWTLETGFKPEGALLLIPLEPGNKVPENNLQLSVERGFYVDEEGEETVRFEQSNSFLGRVAGVEDVRRLRSLSFAAIGETLEMTTEDVLGYLKVKGPPTYQPRVPAATPHVAYKPAAPSTGATLKALLGKAIDAAEKGDFKTSIDLANGAVALAPQNALVLKTRGILHTCAKNHLDAGKDFTAALNAAPDDDELYKLRSKSYSALGYYTRAAADLAEHVKRKPDDLASLNSLAWMLATNPDPAVRNGKLAVTYGEKACELTQYKNGFYLDTLAAACAEAGDLKRAVRLQTVAVETIGDEYKAAAEERLITYESGKPCREDPRSLQ